MRLTGTLVLGFAVAALAACDSEAPGPPEPTGLVQEARLVPADPEASVASEYSVSLAADRALIGVPGAGVGAAYVFVRSGSGWFQEARLSPDDAIRGFGESVSLSGDRALVSSPDERGEPVVYVFVRTGDGWVQEAKLAAGLTRRESFGNFVSLSGDRALIGAFQDAPQGLRSGSAYVFVRTGEGWSQEAVLTADDREWHDFFGHTVSLSGDRALVGAPNRGHYRGAKGMAFVFVRSGDEWVQEAELTVDLAGEYDTFGTAVSLSGDRALIGAQFINYALPVDPVASGAAYVFARSGSGWSQEAELTVDGGYLDESAVSLSGEQALIRSQSGAAAYWFTRSGEAWTLRDSLTASEGIGDSQSWGAISLSGDRALIGTSHSAGSGALVFSGLSALPLRSGQP